MGKELITFGKFRFDKEKDKIIRNKPERGIGFMDLLLNGEKIDELDNKNYDGQKHIIWKYNDELWITPFYKNNIDGEETYYLITAFPRPYWKKYFAKYFENID